MTAILLAVIGIICVIALEALRWRLAAVQREQKAFIAILSHQLRTHMTSIRWYANMFLSGDFGPLSIAALEAAQKIQTSAERTAQILTKFLEISQLERDDVVTSPTAVDIPAEVRKILSPLQALAQQKKITLDMPPDGSHLSVFIDPLLLHAIIDPVAQNAVVYTPEGGTVTVRVEAEDSYVVVRVADTGVGIAPKDRKRIFGKFFRGPGAALLSPDGNGLGLYLSRQILRKLGGTISFTSQEGRGTTFTLKFPRSSPKA